MVPRLVRYLLAVCGCALYVLVCYACSTACCTLLYVLVVVSCARVCWTCAFDLAGRLGRFLGFRDMLPCSMLYRGLRVCLIVPCACEVTVALFRTGGFVGFGLGAVPFDRLRRMQAPQTLY